MDLQRLSEKTPKGDATVRTMRINKGIEIGRNILSPERE